MNALSKCLILCLLLQSLPCDAAGQKPSIKCQSSVVATNTVALSLLFMDNIDRLVPVTSNSYANTQAALGHMPRDLSLTSGIYYDERSNEVVVFAKGTDIERTVLYVNTLTAYLIAEIHKEIGVHCYINHPARPIPFPPLRTADGRSGPGRSGPALSLEFKDDAPPAATEPPAPKP